MLELELLLVIVVLVVVSFIALTRKWVGKKTTLIAIIVSLIVYFLGNFYAFLALVTFFLVGEGTTRLMRKNGKKHDRRNISNLLGNSGAAVLALLFGSIPAFFGCMSCALSDTMSSEIGQTSKKKPWMITTFKKVTTGTDGAVSALGLIAGLTGAIIIGIIYFLFDLNLIGMGIIIFAGFAGHLIDSFLGATLERKKVIGNTTVNFLACAVSGIITSQMFLFI
ncbi:MAG: DUF92 domain-containing protein [archaeon]